MVIVLIFLMIASLLVYFFIARNIKIVDKPLLVDITDQTCKADDDCILAMVECSCDCGIPINKIYWQKYLDVQEEKCRNYQGPYCKIDCLVEPKCIKNICVSN